MSRDAAITITSTCLAMRARYVERVITRIYNQHTLSLGLTVAQVTLLAAVVQNPGVRAVDLSNGLAFDRSTLSRTLSKLRTMGLIETRAGGGRSRRLHATAAGDSKLAEIEPVWEQAQAEAVDLLGPEAEHLVSVARHLSV